MVFQRSPDGDWKRIDSKGNVKDPMCKNQGEPKPKCMSKAKRAKLSKKERAAAVRAKRKHDPVADRAGKGGKPINVSNFGKGKISKEDVVNDSEFIKEVRERGSDKDSGSISERKKGILTKTSTPGTQDPKLKNTTSQTSSRKPTQRRNADNIGGDPERVNRPRDRIRYGIKFILKRI